jgi:hypothetical protein
MKMRTILTVSLLALLTAVALGTGCSSSSTSQCESLCAAANTCPGATAMDCTTFCTQSSTDAETTGCTSEYDAVLDCGTPSNVCDTTNPCPTQTTALQNCVTTYCTAHPTSSACGSSSAGTGTSGSSSSG